MKKVFILKNRLGLHVRASSKLVDSACKQNSEVMLTYQGRHADGKRILEVMALGVKFGDAITVTIKGIHKKDEEEAMRAMEQLITDGFDEGE